MGWIEEFSLEVTIRPLNEEQKENQLKRIQNAKDMAEVKQIIKETPLTPNEIIKDFRKENPFVAAAINDDGSSFTNLSWGDAYVDLGHFSMKHPNALFILTCTDREENIGQEYRVYANDGRVSTVSSIVVVKYPEFDVDRFCDKLDNFITHLDYGNDN